MSTNIKICFNFGWNKTYSIIILISFVYRIGLVLYHFIPWFTLWKTMLPKIFSQLSLQCDLFMHESDASDQGVQENWGRKKPNSYIVTVISIIMITKKK